jgi:hypothetical protein
MSEVSSLGQVAYEAYLEVSYGRSLVSGATLPSWEDQDELIREAWEHVADTVIVRYGDV